MPRDGNFAFGSKAEKAFPNLHVRLAAPNDMALAGVTPDLARGRFAGIVTAT